MIKFHDRNWAIPLENAADLHVKPGAARETGSAGKSDSAVLKCRPVAGRHFYRTMEKGLFPANGRKALERSKKMAQGKLFQIQWLPQFRESDADGRIGLRGYMNCFQDAATHYMHDLGLGNDTLPERFGTCWVFTKYKLRLFRKADFTAPLQLECWVEQEKRRPSIRLTQDLEISRAGELCACGRLEECLMELPAGKFRRLSDIGFPLEAALDRQVEVEPFARVRNPDLEDLEDRGRHTVCYTDLDKSGHMNNLRYVEVLLNAFDSRFWAEHFPTDFEIHYLSQCYEGEVLTVRRRVTETGAEVWVVKADGTAAAAGLFRFGTEQ